MKLLKIPFHSFVDAITNSSTTIYTYCENSVDAAKEMIKSFLNTFDVNIPVDSIFGIVCMGDIDDYAECITDLTDTDLIAEINSLLQVDDTSDFKEVRKAVEAMVEKIALGIIPEPTFIKTLDDMIEKGNDYMRTDTSLYIIAKEEKYATLANKVKMFLDSPSHNGRYDG